MNPSQNILVNYRKLETSPAASVQNCSTFGLSASSASPNCRGNVSWANWQTLFQWHVVFPMSFVSHLPLALHKYRRKIGKKSSPRVPSERNHWRWSAQLLQNAHCGIPNPDCSEVLVLCLVPDAQEAAWRFHGQAARTVSQGHSMLARVLGRIKQWGAGSGNCLGLTSKRFNIEKLRERERERSLKVDLSCCKETTSAAFSFFRVNRRAAWPMQYNIFLFRFLPPTLTGTSVIWNNWKIKRSSKISPENVEYYPMSFLYVDVLFPLPWIFQLPPVSECPGLQTWKPIHEEQFFLPPVNAPWCSRCTCHHPVL